MWSRMAYANEQTTQLQCRQKKLQLEEITMLPALPLSIILKGLKGRRNRDFAEGTQFLVSPPLNFHFKIPNIFQTIDEERKL